MNKILDEFTTKVTKDQWEGKARESRASGKQVLVDYPSLNEYVLKYQDPKQADTIMRVQQELDETKIILVSLRSLVVLDAVASRWKPPWGGAGARCIKDSTNPHISPSDSTRPSRVFSSEGRSSTASSTNPPRCRKAQRRSTRPQRSRCVLASPHLNV